MHGLMRWSPALLAVAVALPGCGGSGNVDTADPSLARVTIEVKGMT